MDWIKKALGGIRRVLKADPEHEAMGSLEPWRNYNFQVTLNYTRGRLAGEEITKIRYIGK